MPSSKEQELIVTYLDSKLGAMDLVEQNLTAQIECFGNYRKSLIHECVTGKRRISEMEAKIKGKGVALIINYSHLKR